MGDTFSDKIKIWSFPTIMAILSALIWNDVQTIKINLSLALMQTTIDKANIENLTNRVNRIESYVFKEGGAYIPYGSNKNKDSLFINNYIAVKPEDKIYIKKDKKTSL